MALKSNNNKEEITTLKELGRVLGVTEITACKYAKFIPTMNEIKSTSNHVYRKWDRKYIKKISEILKMKKLPMFQLCVELLDRVNELERKNRELLEDNQSLSEQLNNSIEEMLDQ